MIEEHGPDKSNTLMRDIPLSLGLRKRAKKNRPRMFPVQTGTLAENISMRNRKSGRNVREAIDEVAERYSRGANGTTKSDRI